MRYYVERGQVTNLEWSRSYEYNAIVLDLPDFEAAKAWMQREGSISARAGCGTQWTLRLWSANGDEIFYVLDGADGKWFVGEPVIYDSHMDRRGDRGLIMLSRA